MSLLNVDSELLNSTLATITEIGNAVNQTGNDNLAGKAMLDFEWFEGAENFTSTFNSTGNETVDGRTIFFYPNIPTIEEEHATTVMSIVLLITIVMSLICAAIYKFYVLPKRRTRGTDTDTECKFRLMENELDYQHEYRF